MQQPETHNNEQCMIQDGTVVNRDNITVHDTRFSSYKQTLKTKRWIVQSVAVTNIQYMMVHGTIKDSHKSTINILVLRTKGNSHKQTINITVYGICWNDNTS